MPGKRPRRSAGLLRRDADFRRFWSADIAGQLAARGNLTVIPLLATTTLSASAFEVSVLRALETLGVLLVSLQAGVLIDRTRTRPIMIGADLARALVILSVPLAAAVGMLSLAQLFAVVLITGVLTVFFDIAHQTCLPRLVSRHDLVDANSLLQTNHSLAAVTGPALGGSLTQVMGAAAPAAGALGHLWSAVRLRGLRVTETAAPAGRTRLRTAIAEGLRLIIADPIMRALACFGALLGLAQAAFLAVSVVFLVHDVGLSPVLVGLLGTTGLTGALAGAAATRTLVARLGDARLLLVCALGLALAYPLYPLTTPGAGLLLYALAGFGASFAIIVITIVQSSSQQTRCPSRLLGRLNATMRFINLGVVPLGSLLGGLLAEAAGTRASIGFAALGVLVAVIPLLASPLRGLRELPRTELGGG